MDLGGTQPGPHVQRDQYGNPIPVQGNQTSGTAITGRQAATGLNCVGLIFLFFGVALGTFGGIMTFSLSVAFIPMFIFGIMFTIVGCIILCLATATKGASGAVLGSQGTQQRVQQVPVQQAQGNFGPPQGGYNSPPLQQGYGGPPQGPHQGYSGPAPVGPPGGYQPPYDGGQDYGAVPNAPPPLQPSYAPEAPSTNDYGYGN